MVRLGPIAETVNEVFMSKVQDNCSKTYLIEHLN